MLALPSPTIQWRLHVNPWPLLGLALCVISAILMTAACAEVIAIIALVL
jgi:hypothetical protein